MRFYMNVCDGHAVAPDPEGSDYADEPTARQAAIEAARTLLAAGDAKGICRRHWKFEVRDSGQNHLFDVPFSHALEPDTLKLGEEHCGPS